ncbi:MAG TPA: BlaI/MecI/CopY family transcriptional regulator [Pirellulales bacterium]|nr:BlaI/MecI/CopY family transcriptional regulator [Pirellulales bacterium]
MKPTERELDILQVLWERKEATVREVYEELRDRLPIVQNTVQAFLRTMEEKGLVKHRIEGRTFIYRPVQPRQQTARQLAAQLLERAFGGAVDQLVQSVLEARQPTSQELEKLEELIAEARAAQKKTSEK